MDNFIDDATHMAVHPPTHSTAIDVFIGSSFFLSFELQFISLNIFLSVYISFNWWTP